MADIIIADNICKYWQDDITQGEGTSYNCNKNKDRYDQLGIGQIKRNDADKREALNQVIGYLIKNDHYIQAQIPHGKRTFGRSEDKADRLRLGKKKKSVPKINPN